MNLWESGFLSLRLYCTYKISLPGQFHFRFEEYPLFLGCVTMREMLKTPGVFKDVRCICLMDEFCGKQALRDGFPMYVSRRVLGITSIIHIRSSLASIRQSTRSCRAPS